MQWPLWLTNTLTLYQNLGLGIGLTISHLTTRYLAISSDARLMRSLLKGRLDMSTATSPYITAIETELPILIKEFKSFAKVVLDNALAGDDASKATQLSTMFKPAFNAEYAKLNLPSWALGEADVLFDGFISGLVITVDTVEVPAA